MSIKSIIFFVAIIGMVSCRRMRDAPAPDSNKPPAGIVAFVQIPDALEQQLGEFANGWVANNTDANFQSAFAALDVHLVASLNMPPEVEDALNAKAQAYTNAGAAASKREAMTMTMNKRQDGPPAVSFFTALNIPDDLEALLNQAAQTWADANKFSMPNDAPVHFSAIIQMPDDLVAGLDGIAKAYVANDAKTSPPNISFVIGLQLPDQLQDALRSAAGDYLQKAAPAAAAALASLPIVFVGGVLIPDDLQSQLYGVIVPAPTQ